MKMSSSRGVKEYLSHHHVSELLESVLTGLLFHRPDDPVSFLQSCLASTSRLGGPEAITWDTFIHLEGHTLSPGPPATAPRPPRTSSIPPVRPLPPIKPQTSPPVLLITSKTTFILSTTPQIPSQTTIAPIDPKTSPPKPKSVAPIPQTLIPTPPITPKTTLIPSTIAQITPTIPSKSTILPKEPKTPTPLIQTIPPIPQKSPTSPLIGPPSPPPSRIALPTRSGSQIPYIKSSAEPRVLVTAPPGPAVTPPPDQRGEPGDSKTFSADDPPPPPGPLSPVRSQLSIDSDSDMTESSGLWQEVSILAPQRPRPLIIFIIGGPGSGKGTQASRLAQRFGLRVVSLEELLRRQLLGHASPSKKWRFISEMMGHGELGLQEEMVSELRRLLIGQQEVRGFIVDGFPRDVHQALSFQEQVGCPHLVMLLLCSNQTLHCRLQRRAAQLGLLGDNSHALRRRLDTFQRDVVSIRRYYRQTHLLTQVDADRDQQAVFTDLSSVIREKFLLKDYSAPADFPECSSAIPSGTNQRSVISVSCDLIG